MTTKVKGTEGIEFPDATVQASAAFTKAEINAQSWQNVTASRLLDVNYTNSTGKPIDVSVFAANGANSNFTLLVGGVAVATQVQPAGAGCGIYGRVPNGATYRVRFETPQAPDALVFWQELR